MGERDTTYQVGDKVIHWVHGLGEVIRLDEKELSGQTAQYYVVKIRDLTLWVPRDEAGETSLRYLTPARDFPELFRLLASSGEELPPEHFQRKTQLTQLLKEGSLESICRVVRDLVHHKRTQRLNESDNFILKRAKNSLLNEWSAALSVPVLQAERELNQLLNTAA